MKLNIENNLLSVYIHKVRRYFYKGEEIIHVQYRSLFINYVITYSIYFFLFIAYTEILKKKKLN